MVVPGGRNYLQKVEIRSRHWLRAAVMTVAPQRDPGGRPMTADAPHQSADMVGDLGA
jgi:hypothetical protein